MQPFRILAAVVALIAFGDQTTASMATPKAGDEYEITRVSESSEESSSGSTSSSHDRDTVLERVVAVHSDGLELEYDLPHGVTPEERASVWQFPAKVFKPVAGPTVLLNTAELEVRRDAWLAAAKWTREVCGRWIFTWNAFQVQCDPQSVLNTIQAFDLRPTDMRDGATYFDNAAAASGQLVEQVGREGRTFSAVMQVDADAVRSQRAEADVAVGEMMQQPVTLETALRKRSTEAITGTITVSFETDLVGNVQRRTKLTKLQIVEADGQTVKQPNEETVERREVTAP